MTLQASPLVPLLPISRSNAQSWNIPKRQSYAGVFEDKNCTNDVGAAPQMKREGLQRPNFQPRGSVKSFFISGEKKETAIARPVF
jgi:hypothetical protein